MTPEERKKFEQDLEQMKKRHNEHEKVKHPGSRDQLEEVWEDSDKMEKENFDPRTFFALHDLNGDGFWSAEELEALFQLELQKVYNESDPDDDPRERIEEMYRMREHVVQQMDKNNDRMISLAEFLAVSYFSFFLLPAALKGQQQFNTCILLKNEILKLLYIGFYSVHRLLNHIYQLDVHLLCIIYFMQDAEAQTPNKDDGWKDIGDEAVYSDDELKKFEEEYAKQQGWGEYAYSTPATTVAHRDAQQRRPAVGEQQAAAVAPVQHQMQDIRVDVGSQQQQRPAAQAAHSAQSQVPAGGEAASERQQRLAPQGNTLDKTYGV
ncbi:unnamed protein product [Toxocara canis]|uniref:EF-hand domain-containing protein n=1 Tax=Toxocara canis TaxID=6265 RepID=A0A183UVX6_TOXCA|nr:unnamed protein product [Toxocara canis]